jgi:hypothetical protein
MKFPASLHKLAALLLIFAIAASARPAGAQAQGEKSVTLESVVVDVWPEYDQPAVLVIYHVTVAASTSLPATLSLSIPTAAGKPYAVAMQDANGLYDLQYNLTPAGDWTKVTFTTPTPEVRVEFYDPGLARDGSKRSFSFRWPADYTVNNLVVQVQQPAGASGMTFLPDIGDGRQGNDGLTYFTQVVGEVTAGTAFTLDASYTKTADTLTNTETFKEVQPNAPVDSATPGRVPLFSGISITPLQLMLLAAGLTLILGGAIWYGIAAGNFGPLMRAVGIGRENQSSGRRRHARAAESDEPDAAGGATFCHQCGKKSGPGDAFCRACGTKLKI